jgi:hypothetical protein
LLTVLRRLLTVLRCVLTLLRCVLTVLRAVLERERDQKLRVCDICGAFLSIYDSDRRLADHFGGKMHLGYQHIRDKIKQVIQRCKRCES